MVTKDGKAQLDQCNIYTNYSVELNKTEPCPDGWYYDTEVTGNTIVNEVHFLTPASEVDFPMVRNLFNSIKKYIDCVPDLPLRRPDPISCRKWDVSYFTTLKKKITNFYVAYAAIYSNNTLTNECWK